ncbi:hypothetical protein LUZ60_010510 [Juncus effusus]|nr:hypothetical protein LUZ60_010510 [Juncus effusus]
MAIGEDGLAAAAAAEPPPTANHYLAKCILRGSVVVHAVEGCFRSPSSSDFVFGRETSLELVEFGENGVLQTVFEQTVFGIIKDIAVLSWHDRYQPYIPQAQGRDLLVVISDSGKLSFLAFSSEMHRFMAITHVELSQPGNARNQLGRMIAVDPEGYFVAVSAYDDKFVILPVAQSAGNSFIKDKISYPFEPDENLKGTSRASIRGTIWSMCFIASSTNHLYTEGYYHPILAVVMHRRGASGNELLLFGYNNRLSKISILSRYSEFGHLALTVTTVPHFPGFVFLFRVGDVLLMDLRNPEILRCIHKITLPLSGLNEDKNFTVDISKTPPALDDEIMFDEAACALLELRDSGDEIIGNNYDVVNNNNDPMNIDTESESQDLRFICAWSWQPDVRTCAKLLFCFDNGDIFALEMNFNAEGISINISDCLYSGQPCKSLLWLQSGLVLGLVEMGDGMVLKFKNGILEYTGSIQSIAPILDSAIADFHDEKQDQIFACCGMKPDGSLRVIRSGISVEKLLKTAPVYQGVSGTWSLKMRKDDLYHSFLVLSFLEETRVLSVGLSFSDVTDYIGFQSDVSTLACGLVADLALVQIHNKGVRLCLPTSLAHSEGLPVSVPVFTSWTPPEKLSINVGAVGDNMVLVSTSNPSFLYILGIKSHSDDLKKHEMYEIHRVFLHHEISCMSIPHEKVQLTREQTQNENAKQNASKVVVIGTHKPSVEIFSLETNELFRLLAVGRISVSNSLGCPISGCVPESVRLVLSDRLYVLSGLRNGMLLRFEWSKFYFFSPNESSDRVSKSETAILEMIAVRRIGIMPVSLVSLSDKSGEDLIVLSDRPWILHASRQSLAYTSVSFQSASHVTAVKFADCPFGILFVSENSLHLVEMVHSKRLNVQKFPIEGNPRKILYHSETKTLFVIRTGLDSSPSCSSDICQVDPLTGSLVSKFKFEEGETAKCFTIVNSGSGQVLVVGTSRSAVRPIMPTGEPESTKGRVVILSLKSTQSFSPFHDVNPYGSDDPTSPSKNPPQFEEAPAGAMRLVSQSTLNGAVLAVCSYVDNHFLAAAGNVLSVFGFVGESPHRLRKLAITRTRFTITCLKSFLRRIAVGDCRDGILFYSYHEEQKKLELEFSDPAQRVVADCALMDCETAVVSDRRGSISILSCIKNLEAYESPEKNLNINCSFYMGETVMSIQKASFSYKLLIDDGLNGGNGSERLLESAYNSIVASTLLGSVFILIPLTREEQQLLAVVQDRLSNHKLTSPVLGNDHKEFRSRGAPAGVPTILDGDLLVQFLELTSLQQEAVLMSPGGQSTKFESQAAHITVNQVVQTLERVHYALT